VRNAEVLAGGAPRLRSPGLLIDFGGVLTTNVFESFRAFCEDEGLEPNAFLDMFRDDAGARRDLRQVEVGLIDEDEFARRIGERLGIERTENFIDRLFARMAPDGEMVAAVKRVKAEGVPTGLVSNSLGSGRYDREAFPELFDGVVISGEVGFHKPQPEIFRLGAESIGLPPERCVFVDDLRENCDGAEAVGMTAILHRGADSTLPELERLLGVGLR
jgi:epoxide hydrolase-like predicted phosphatase